ncbi:Nudix family hydrolase [Gammaproteobacteria bacterium AB-CW1]|uniref:8-oxo-dGTP diphosphatase n=1 Tax=Natronospira elongata TaxID=3110268 RepID=A0AAP6JEV8_9GAMM|nr:Nudix family hydrolase [Gammaproteobacteria bacterium AB-CW1]
MARGERLRIVAAVLRDQDGRILVSTRPAGRSMSGRWEFPGGKREPGEGRWAALVRELSEELDLHLVEGRPLIRIQHDYPDGPAVDLDVWLVTAWEGAPRALEGQQFDWFAPEALSRLDFLAANTPIVTAARLPDRYLVTPPDFARLEDLVAGVEAAARRGISLIQLRGDWLRQSGGQVAAKEAVARARAAGASVLINGDPGLAEKCQADGVHLPARLAAGLESRPVVRPGLVGVSCHDEAELRHAEALGADFVTLGHVRPTPSHPGAEPLGMDRFLALAGSASLPVYAIGGMGVADLPALHQQSIQGIAAIRGLGRQLFA